MGPRALLAGAAVVGGLAWWRAQGGGGFDMTVGASGLPGGPAPSPQVKAMAEAIARAEGFYASGNPIPKRAHNPGNMKLGDVGNGTINGITVYTSDAQGWAALYRQLGLIISGRSRVYTLSMTLAAMGRKWTATTHEQSAWANNVARTLGTSSASTLGQLLT